MTKLISLLVLLTLLGSAPAVAQDLLNQVAREIEEQGMQRLRAQQTRPGVKIDAFNSDGCSGGMSQTWKSVAGIWPEFARGVGNLPPWEYCCVAHDRDYWRGDSINGFDKRLQSDIDLRQCVEEAGRQQAGQIAQRIGLTRDEVIEVFGFAAGLMYQAVRLGGGPCTGLAWRWGHGWPPCDLESEPVNEDLINAHSVETGPVDPLPIGRGWL